MLVEVARKAYLASIVPVIVNAILNEHQIIVDIVAFVNKGDFPRSRLGEKQRGKILAGWVSRKMRTMAQFAIKDMDSAILGPPGTASGESGQSAQQEEAFPRASLSSFRSAGYPGAGSSSLRNVEPAPQILEQRELEQMENHRGIGGGGGYLQRESPPAPLGLVEMPADERLDVDRTPTKNHSAQFTSAANNNNNNNRVSVAALPHGYDLPDFDRFGSEDEEPAPPAVGPKPASPPQSSLSGAPQIRLPGVDGRESLDDGRAKGGAEDDWTRDAYMSMNLAGRLQ